MIAISRLSSTICVMIMNVVKTASCTTPASWYVSGARSAYRPESTTLITATTMSDSSVYRCRRSTYSAKPKPARITNSTNMNESCARRAEGRAAGTRGRAGGRAGG